jgi:hypothetical protein
MIMLNGAGSRGPAGTESCPVRKREIHHAEALARYVDTCGDGRNRAALRSRAELSVVLGQRSKGLDELRIREPPAMPAVGRWQCRALRRQSGPSVSSCAWARTTAAKRLASKLCGGPRTLSHVTLAAPLKEKGAMLRSGIDPDDG